MRSLVTTGVVLNDVSSLLHTHSDVYTGVHHPQKWMLRRPLLLKELVSNEFKSDKKKTATKNLMPVSKVLSPRI